MTELNVIVLLFFGICFAEKQPAPNSFPNDQRASDGDVIHVSMLFRHGDRTPTRILPTDPYELSYWEEGLGQLTKIGKLRAYNLGKWTRLYYAALVANKPYKYDVITIQSSDVDRTLMSAEAFLAGLYPPTDEEMWNNENIRWQPIPVHTTSKHLDNIIAFPDGICERYDLEKASIIGRQYSLYEEHRDIFEYVRIHSGVDMSIDNINKAMIYISDIYSTLWTEVYNNRTIQNWAHEVFPEPLKSITVLTLFFITYTSEMKRLRGGPLLKSMIDDMTEKASGRLENAAFHIYSGHDTTIFVLLNTLGVYNGILPPYSAAVMIELRKKDEDHFVRILYRNSSLVAPYTLEIPGCESDVCTLDKFIQVTASLIPDNWQNECKVDFLTKLFYKVTVLQFILMVVAVLFVVVLIATAARQYYISSHRRKDYQEITDSGD